MDQSIFDPPASDPALTAFLLGDLLPTGNETIPRPWADAFGAVHMAGSGFIMLSYFTAYRTETANFVACQTGSAGAGATPTLCKMGLYLVNNQFSPTNNLTLLSATANDTALFANPYAGYKRQLLTPVAMTAGTRYAFGILVVSAFGMPAIACQQGALNDTYGSGKNAVGVPPYVQQSTVQADMVSLSAAQITPQGSNWGKAWAYFSNT